MKDLKRGLFESEIKNENLLRKIERLEKSNFELERERMTKHRDMLIEKNSKKHLQNENRQLAQRLLNLEDSKSGFKLNLDRIKPMGRRTVSYQNEQSNRSSVDFNSLMISTKL